MGVVATRWSRRAFAVLGILALGLAGMACHKDDNSTCSDTGGSGGAGACSCDVPDWAAAPMNACDPTFWKINDQCPVPDEATSGDGNTVADYSNPTCEDGSATTA